MLVAMAITLVMMAAVVTVFTNVSGSVTRRRATIEMAGALRSVREVLARDLRGATCPAVTWQRPDSNSGYLEFIEGPQNDFYPSPWLYDSSNDGPDGLANFGGQTPGIDLSISTLPGSNLRDPDPPGVTNQQRAALAKREGRGRIVGSNEPLPERVATDGRGLGDSDDILMFTTRSESEPFVGRVPSRTALTQGLVGNIGTRPNAGGPELAFPFWPVEEMDSAVAEVVWYSFENPTERDSARTAAFGEPGYRTIHRRVLLVAPSLNYQFRVGNNGPVTGPGVVRVLLDGIDQDDPHLALASLIAFQERFDLSVRLEWDPLLGADGRWVIKANSLADLTSRENRYEHHGLVFRAPNNQSRQFPFALISAGQYRDVPRVRFFLDPEYGAASPSESASFEAVLADGAVVAYEPNTSESAAQILRTERRYPVRPLAVVETPVGDVSATARAIRNEDGVVVHVTRGLAPLSGQTRTPTAAATFVSQPRFGEDVMLSDVLGFDLRVYDPGAPLYAYFPGGTTTARADYVVAPGDPAWPIAFKADVPGWLTPNYAPATDVIGNIATSNNVPFAFQRRGAYVDMGYGDTCLETAGSALGTIPNQFTRFSWLGSNAWASGDFSPLKFFWPGDLRTPTRVQLAPGYSVYDTWSTHAESNGLDDDGDGAIDEETNGLDDPGSYLGTIDTRLGPDDTGERETQPPFDTALRGVQVTLRAYERDSRQVRQTSVVESFVPE
jgi:type II secretory pathway pseudopilin PulG